MNSKRLAGIVIVIFIFLMGCSGNHANIKNQSEEKSKVTKQELIDNWSGYDIWYNFVVIVFDPKSDDKKILVDNLWNADEEQETLTKIVEGTHTSPGGLNVKVWEYETREIWVHNQFYGYVIQKPRELVAARIVDENTVRLTHQYSGDWR